MVIMLDLPENGNELQSNNELQWQNLQNTLITYAHWIKTGSKEKNIQSRVLKYLCVWVKSTLIEKILTDFIIVLKIQAYIEKKNK